MYLIKMPWWIKAFYSSFIWRIKTKEKVLYLTFDDGPNEKATPFVLDELKKYNAKATFFCIGNNVAGNRDIYRRILTEGHAIGNHTYHHLNGWKTTDEAYIKDVNEAAKEIDSHLFRPPYGRISKFKASLLQQQNFTIIMWDILSADFDTGIQPKKCLANVIYHAREGSIIVFHDSIKAWERMSYALPAVLEHFSKDGYSFKAIGH
jgi:peptidoglycan/xylan/chitin deacetylase (PgdA/CDA1 family)